MNALGAKASPAGVGKHPLVPEAQLQRHAPRSDLAAVGACVRQRSISPAPMPYWQAALCALAATTLAFGFRRIANGGEPVMPHGNRPLADRSILGCLFLIFTQGYPAGFSQSGMDALFINRYWPACLFNQEISTANATLAVKSPCIPASRNQHRVNQFIERCAWSLTRFRDMHSTMCQNINASFLVPAIC
ncbi:hypothetical protein GGR77_003627 [Xanthomonas translucens]